MTDELATRFPPGLQVDGKYRIVRVLGRGGMGLVLEAYHELLAQPVALKVVLPELASHPDIVARFLNEARAAAKIESQNVARVMDVGRLEDGTPFMVMELLTGRDLDVVLADEGPLGASRLADLMLEALEGVAHAHALGIVHRDLKPANLFLSERAGRAPQVKVLDFGIAKALSATPFEGAQVTSTKSILGSPAYMAPEQLRSSKSVDARADIWSLGVIAYHLAAGELPFDGDSVGALFATVLEDPPKPLTRPDLPAPIAQIIARCLAKKPEGRFQSAHELAMALAPFGTRTAARALERIEAIAASPPPGSELPGSESSPTTSGDPDKSAFAATHASEPGLYERVEASRAPIRTNGNWSEGGEPSKHRPNWAPLALGVGIVGLAGIGILFVARAGRSAATTEPLHGRLGSASAAMAYEDTLRQAEQGAEQGVAPVAPATASANTPEPPTSTVPAHSGAAPSAASSAAPSPKRGPRNISPAPSDDLFGRF